METTKILTPPGKAEQRISLMQREPRARLWWIFNSYRYLTAKAGRIVLPNIVLVSLYSCSFILPALSRAQWVHLGLQHEEITSIIVDPRNETTLYAGSSSDFSSGTRGKIFKSTNRGGDWQVIFDGVSVSDLRLCPDSSNILYAALGPANASPPGIVKTTDAGATWIRADSGIFVDSETGVNCLAINPRKPDNLFAGTNGATYRTTNGGKSWLCLCDTIRPGPSGITAISIDPDSTNRIYLSDSRFGTIYNSTDDGITWQSTLPAILYGAGGTGFALGSDPSTLYLAALAGSQSPKGMFKSTDRGETWSNIVTGIPGTYANVWCVTKRKHTSPDELFIGLLWGNNTLTDSILHGSVFSSCDGGHTWNYLGLDSTRVSSLALSPDEKYLYAGVSITVRNMLPLGVYRLDLGTLNISEPTRKIYSFKLYQNYPNPFNLTTTLAYELPSGGEVDMRIYNTLGEEIRTILSEYEDAGVHFITWDGLNEQGESIGSGVYFLRASLKARNLQGSHLFFRRQGLVLMK